MALVESQLFGYTLLGRARKRLEFFFIFKRAHEEELQVSRSILQRERTQPRALLFCPQPPTLRSHLLSPLPAFGGRPIIAHGLCDLHLPQYSQYFLCLRYGPLEHARHTPASSSVSLRDWLQPLLMHGPGWGVSTLQLPLEPRDGKGPLQPSGSRIFIGDQPSLCSPFTCSGTEIMIVLWAA